ncbi:MAG: hypothetical protein RIB64_15115 [Arenibacter algicola]
MKNIRKVYLLGNLSILLVVLGCKGDMGPQGDAGINSLTSLSAEPLGTNCENGGVRINIGMDANGNGILETNETMTTNYICNGLDGLVSLTNVIMEPIGANCPNGGYNVNSGLDANSNGTLEANEITANAFICNGLDGGNALIRTMNEPAGDDCPKGGIKIDSGIDLDANGILAESEVTSSALLCNGEDGNISLVNLTEIAANVDCPNGGIILDSGIDDNGNGILDYSEIQSTRNVCNGLDGAFNEEIRLVFGSSTIGISSGTNFVEGRILTSLQKFDIRHYDMLHEAILTTRSYTENSATQSFIELVNEDTGEVIPNSTLSSSFTSYSGQLLISPNIYKNFPQEEITLGLRLRSGKEGINVYITGRSELILTRGN